MMDPLTSGLVNAAISAASNVSRGEFLRFARRIIGSRWSLSLEKEASTTRIAEQVGELLAQSDKLDESVFDELVRMNPSGVEPIEKARELWRERNLPGESAEGEESPRGALPPQSPPESPPAEGDERLKRLFKAISEARPLSAAIPDKLVEGLALLASFDALALGEIGLLRLIRSELSLSQLIEDLAMACDQLPDGRWSLLADKRREALGRAVANGSLAEALELARAIDEDARNAPYLALIEEFLEYGRIEVRFGMSYEQLLVAQEVADWFAGVAYSPLDSDQVAILLDSQRRIEPLRKLVGTHFRGRDQQLAVLRRGGSFGEGGERVLALTGNGGAGKSALLGKRILELLEASPPAPVVYIDFDRTEADPADPRGLVEIIARSLSLLYAGSAEGASFIELESATAGDVAFPDLGLGLRGDASLDELVAALADRIAALPGGRPPLFVFDTFEQVMLRGGKVVGGFQQFLGELLDAVPGALAVVAGRGSVACAEPAVAMKLTDLDADSADAVLEARGVEQPELRRRIYEAIGGSPLLLRIASAAVASGRLGLQELEAFAAQAEGLRRHGLLYSRILGYIGDEQVERLAHPGLIVRRVTPGVIREVLAEICELDPADAEAIFERLPRFVDLFEPEDPLPGEDEHQRPPGLQHRQDLREGVIDLMVDDAKWRDRIPDIHRRALAYYEGRQDLRGRAEWLYHALMLDTPPEELDPIWDPSHLDALAVSLGRTWSDPLPARARRWLGLRLGYEPDAAGEDLRLADWEVATAQTVRALFGLQGALTSPPPASETLRLMRERLNEALRLMRERAQRTALSPLPPLEVHALLETHRAEEAHDVAEAALERARGQARPPQLIDLLLLAAETALAADLPARAAEAAGDARELAQALGNERARLKALELAARAQADGAERELAVAFLEAAPSVLRSDARTAGMIVRTLGEGSPEVVGKAAKVFAHVPDTRYLSEDPGELQKLLEQVAQKQGGERVLAGLATRVGLSHTETDPSSIAFGAVRHRLHGEAISSSLRAFGDDPGIRAQSFGMLKGLTQ